MNGRLLSLCAAGLALGVILAVLSGSWSLGSAGMTADFSARQLPPSAAHLFGTDHMGRDLFARSLHGLALSLQIGLTAALLSGAISLAVAASSALGPRADAVARFVTDAMLSMPHLLLLLLLSFTLGGGTSAVVMAIALSHWPRLARLLRAELLEVNSSPYVETAWALGRSRQHILFTHILPHLWPQFLAGVLLMFPHAILHEAGLTFLGFGLEPSTPAIGVMLSDAMRHVSAGRWWLALCPGAMLLALVLAFEALGTAVQRLLSPQEEQV